MNWCSFVERVVAVLVVVHFFVALVQVLVTAQSLHFFDLLEDRVALVRAMLLLLLGLFELTCSVDFVVVYSHRHRCSLCLMSRCRHFQYGRKRRRTRRRRRWRRRRWRWWWRWWLTLGRRRLLLDDLVIDIARLGATRLRRLDASTRSWFRLHVIGADSRSLIRSRLIDWFILFNSIPFDS